MLVAKDVIKQKSVLKANYRKLGDSILITLKIRL
jgi:hypothetical protein